MQSNDVTCNSCDEQPRLVEAPTTEDTDYALVCECDITVVDVSDCLNGKSVVKPISGKWSNIDHNHRNGR